MRRGMTRGESGVTVLTILCLSLAAGPHIGGSFASTSTGPTEPPGHYNLHDVRVSVQWHNCGSPVDPASEIIVTGDGSVIFLSAKGDTLPRSRQVHLDRPTLVSLLETFYEVDFFSLRGRYEDGYFLQVSDAGDVRTITRVEEPSCSRTIGLTIGEWSKSVYTGAGGPPGLDLIVEAVVRASHPVRPAVGD